jgi:hypothetical protein
MSRIYYGTENKDFMTFSMIFEVFKIIKRLHGDFKKSSKLMGCFVMTQITHAAFSLPVSSLIEN